MRSLRILLPVFTLTLIILAGCGRNHPSPMPYTPTPVPALSAEDLKSPASEATATEDAAPQDSAATDSTAADATPEAAADNAAQSAASEVTMETVSNDNEALLTAFATGGCSACHVIPGIPGAVGAIGPDLSEIGVTAAQRITDAAYTGSATNAHDYLVESIKDPMAYLPPECPGGPCLPGLMPATLADTLSAGQIDLVSGYLAGLPDGALAASDVTAEADAAATTTAAAPELSEEEWAAATQIFFDRCAGCHGVLRNGATGPALTPDRTLDMGTIALQAIIFNGTPRGMPDWGQQGLLTEEETNMMARFVQNTPPEPPEMSLEQMRDSWQVFIQPEDRPTAPEHDLNIDNFFSVTLRDAGQVAIIDGDTKEIVNIVDSGYAVHISRMSASGRYIYVIGRDGKIALIDLWMEKPDKVAQVQTCYDARSVDGSKYVGEEGDFTDKYAIAGCYWPPHFVIMDGQTLEPMKIVSTRGYTIDTGEYHPEPRVAAIVASHFSPKWVINVKETGQVWTVDYTDPTNPTIKQINAERFLHDGGWDSTGRYFIVAANERNTIAVIDTKTEELAALVPVGTTPHPGRGANWVDPEYGPVWATSHLGQGLLSVIGADPEGHPEYAWKVVREIELAGGGGLFIKTHPESRWVWIDQPLNPDETLQRSVCVVDKQNPQGELKCWQVSDYGRVVHFEYNQTGDEVWVSVWGAADQPGQTGEIVIYDDKTLEEKARIPDLITPTGKFNVYNTVHDIY
ncbi:MAG: c-type cytochrome [Caldilineaceae bacterium]|nr:c-type cytochrome [Caldilineaceae bacterium]